MSLERSIERIAEASEAMARHDNCGHAAVQEIIRQRDKALNDLAGMTNSRDGYKRWESERCEQNYKLERRVAALRGVITRMKRARTK